MYTTISAVDAKLNLSKLLKEVQRGYCYTITVCGHRVADLVPSQENSNLNVDDAIQAMKNIRKIQGVNKETLLDWIHHGQRCTCNI